jgi:3'-phosphoadenosine 5'-phosphosulfate sulfotransferase (PAPS reductase)/FAD synthetase
MIEIITPQYKTPKTTPRLQSLLDESWGILAMNATQIQKQTVIYCLFSGGKDSIVTTHIASHMPEFQGVGHVRTLTGPAANQHSDHANAIAEGFGWPVIEASPSESFASLVVQFGFPGPAAHTWMYIHLKERAIRKISRAARKGKERLIYVTGMRWDESAKRAKTSTERTVISVNEWWVNPILKWTDEDIFEYVNYHGLTVPHRGHSLDCFCGAYATPEEREWIAIEHPEQHEYLTLLEDIVTSGHQLQGLDVQSGHRDAAFPEQFCKWGHGLSMKDIRTDCSVKASLCSTCNGKSRPVNHV